MIRTRAPGTRAPPPPPLLLSLSLLLLLLSPTVSGEYQRGASCDGGLAARQEGACSAGIVPRNGDSAARCRLPAGGMGVECWAVWGCD